MKNILIVTPDIEGPIKNGGIGTAFTALAFQCVNAGHKVTILYTNDNSEDKNKSLNYWQSIYKKNDINFIVLPFEQEMFSATPFFRQRSYSVYTWLKKNPWFDVIIGCEWRADLYYSLLAQHQGLFFDRAKFIINTHGSTLWADEGSYNLPYSQDNLELYFMEKKTVELANEIISPSQYLLNWMIEKKWKLPENHSVLLNCEPYSIEKSLLLENHSNEKTKLLSKKTEDDLTEIVFFGRLETRKGLDVFLKALEYLTPDQLKIISYITFLGKSVRIHGMSSEEYISQKIHKILEKWDKTENYPPNLSIAKQPNFSEKQPTPSLLKKIKILSDMNRTEANNYLKRPNVLAIIPSLVENSPYTVYECLIENINFIASRTGGIAELIASEHVDELLFKLNPIELYTTLSKRIIQRTVACQLKQPPSVIHEQWVTVLNNSETIEEKVDKRLNLEKNPKISVCLVHYNRPKLLQQAIFSLDEQTYDNFEVILVDDGSDDDESKRYIELISPYFQQKNWKIIKSSNNYLGAARNLAARHASGDYLLFMDDDNVAKPNELDTFAKVATQTEADILTTPSHVFCDELYPIANSIKPYYWLPLGGDPNIGAFFNCFGDANALIRKKVFDELGGFTEDYGLGHEDWEFFAKAVLKGYELQVVPESLFYYRCLNEGMFLSGNADKNNFRSYRPYMDPEHKTPYALGLLHTLLSRNRYLESLLFDQSKEVIGRELITIKQNLDHLFSQQKEGWAHDRFNVLNSKVDLILSEERAGWAHDRFNVLNSKVDLILSRQPKRIVRRLLWKLVRKAKTIMAK
ncbi:hypothetical protein COMNV_01093 [Commensalibacter sp. Nvir]|uniref:glycosyltransferase n=1 Tax=Commensalibacter sp. Nvir TaxID=3069817 RepID=UPI002D26BD1C|nr:hypothetical protein COMNV_01093 [Commensalibacter sp. Nvir]